MRSIAFLLRNYFWTENFFKLLQKKKMFGNFFHLNIKEKNYTPIFDAIQSQNKQKCFTFHAKIGSNFIRNKPVTLFLTG